MRVRSCGAGSADADCRRRAGQVGHVTGTTNLGLVEVSSGHHDGGGRSPTSPSTGASTVRSSGMAVIEFAGPWPLWSWSRVSARGPWPAIDDRGPPKSEDGTRGRTSQMAAVGRFGRVPALASTKNTVPMPVRALLRRQRDSTRSLARERRGRTTRVQRYTWVFPSIPSRTSSATPVPVRSTQALSITSVSRR